jgi:nucleoside-diphosphate-sugar epimerase
LYMYGMPERDAAGNARPMREDSPVQPCSHKGELRKKLAELRLSAHQRGELAVAIGRASDFFGPDLAQSFWSERFFRNIAKGSAGECLGDPDMPHAYTYCEDVARGLVTLGERAEASGKVWHLPTEPAESTQALATRVGRAFGVPRAKVKHVPKLLLRGLGLFDPIMRELPEMAYQWEVPYLLDDSRFREAFGYGPTPIDEQVRAVVAWAKPKLAPASASAARAG